MCKAFNNISVSTFDGFFVRGTWIKFNLKTGPFDTVNGNMKEGIKLMALWSIDLELFAL